MVLMNSSLAATIDSLVRTPAEIFHMWAGASRSLEKIGGGGGGGGGGGQALIT